MLKHCISACKTCSYFEFLFGFYFLELTSLFFTTTRIPISLLGKIRMVQSFIEKNGWNLQRTKLEHIQSKKIPLIVGEIFDHLMLIKVKKKINVRPCTKNRKPAWGYVCAWKLWWPKLYFCPCNLQFFMQYHNFPCFVLCCLLVVLFQLIFFGILIRLVLFSIISQVMQLKWKSLFWKL